MKKPKSKRKKFIPLFLVPKVRKRHVLPIFQEHETLWKLFAEGALRNRFFHEEIMKRGSKCLACDRHFNGENAAVSSKIEKHHHCYLRLCIGNLLPSDSDDIYRLAKDGEFPLVPDCRRCKAENPEYYQGCIKKIFPVHGKCHEDIHELEKALFTNLKKKLRANFLSAVNPQNSCTTSPS